MYHSVYEARLVCSDETGSLHSYPLILTTVGESISLNYSIGSSVDDGEGSDGVGDGEGEDGEGDNGGGAVGDCNIVERRCGGGCGTADGSPKLCECEDDGRDVVSDGGAAADICFFATTAGPMP